LSAWLITSETPLFVLNEQQVVVVFNRGCELLTQWPAEEVIGKACSRQVQPNPAVVESVTHLLCPPAGIRSGEPARQRLVLLRRDGTTIEREIHFFLLGGGEDREQQHVMGIMTATLEPLQPASASLDLRRHLAELFRKYRIDRLIARSPRMMRVAAQVEIARQTRATVHLTGEPGAGKEHIARLIHHDQENASRRFVPMRCASATHFELNRLFNRLQELDDSQLPGTVYLDRVDQLPGDLQTPLLSLMSRRTIRWISSSLQGLEELPAERLSPELRSKLTLLTIAVPPLRERSEDLLLLAQQILEETNVPSGKQLDGFTAAVERAMLQYNWPGNVDEMAQVLHRAGQRSTSHLIDVADLPFEFQAGHAGQSIRPIGGALKLEDQLARFESELIAEALSRARGNKSLAAEQLGIPRAKLYRRMTALGLADPSEENPDVKEEDNG
jgi:transcriptional regulator with PAS, ATPase and Fis domain